MRKFRGLVALLGAGAAGSALARRLRQDAGSSAGPAVDRWHVVTVNRQESEITQGGLPEPLTALSATVETRVRPARGDRGTELAARLRSGTAPDDLRELRQALREAKQILETGEVLKPFTPPTTDPTPAGRLLGAVTRHAREEGRL
jgi:hypothetical protein